MVVSRLVSVKCVVAPPVPPRSLRLYPGAQVSLQEINEFADVNLGVVQMIETLKQRGSEAPFVCDPVPAPFLGYSDVVAAVAMEAAERTPVTVTAVCGAHQSGVTTVLRAVAHKLREDAAAFPGGIFFVGLEDAVTEESMLHKLCCKVGARVTGNLKDALGQWCCRQTAQVAVLVDFGQQPLSRWLPVVETLPNPTGMVHWVVGSSAAPVQDRPGSHTLRGLQSVTDAGTIVAAKAPHLAQFTETMFRVALGLPGKLTQLCTLDMELFQTVVSAANGGASAAGPGGKDVLLDAQLARLTPQQCVILAKLSVFPASFSDAAAAAVCELSKEVLLDELESLCSAGLCSQSGGRWRVTTSGAPLPSTFLAPLAEDILAGKARFMQHFSQVYMKADTLFLGQSYMSGMYLFDTERDNIDVLFDTCANALAQPLAVQTALLAFDVGYKLLQWRTSPEVMMSVSGGLLELKKAHAAEPVAKQHLPNAMNTRGTALLFAARYQDSVDIHREALACATEVYGPDHAEVAEALSDIGYSLLRLGDENPDAYTEALRVIQESLEMRYRIQGRKHPLIADTLLCLAEAYSNLGRGDESVQTYKDCLEFQKEVCGGRHPDVSATMYNLGCELLKQGQTQEALKCYLESVAVSREVFGLHHFMTCDSMYNCSYMMLQQERYNEALPLLRECLDATRVLEGKKGERTLATMEMLVTVLDAVGKRKESKAMAAELRALRED